MLIKWTKNIKRKIKTHECSQEEYQNIGQTGEQECSEVTENKTKKQKNTSFHLH